MGPEFWCGSLEDTPSLLPFWVSHLTPGAFGLAADAFGLCERLSGMMPTWWVSCAALVLVAVFVPLLAVAVALPFVDDVRLWVDWYPPLLRAVPYCLVGSYVSLFTHFTLCAILCRLTRRPVLTHAMSCVDLSTCFVDLCFVLSL